MKKLLLLLFLPVFFTFIACQDDDITEPGALDLQLTQALFDASDGRGLSYYRLPKSDQFEKIPQDRRNPLTAEKVELGKLLYHETALGIAPVSTQGEKTYSCASCHHAQGGFQAGIQQGIGEGGTGFGFAGEGRTARPDYTVDMLDIQPIRTPTVLNTAYQEVMLWNGQFGATGLNAGTETSWEQGTPKEVNHLGYEGLESQAIAGMGVHRMEIDEEFIRSTTYREMFDRAFPQVPEEQRYDQERAGLAIAAYERTLLANRAPFQRWLNGERNALNRLEKEGAILFFTKGKCFSCHNGPALSSMSFHALGMKDLEGPGVYGDVPVAFREGRGGFTNYQYDKFRFKTPQLYSLKYSPFYGHGGTFTSVLDVIRYKNEAVKENPAVPDEYLDDEFVPLGLTEMEMQLIATFLENGLDDADLIRYLPESLPSGNCFPNNDPQSRLDLGCE